MSFRVRVDHSGVTDLASDLRKVVRRAPGEMRGVVRQALITGNSVAKDNARRSSGSHGKRYPSAFTWEMGKGFDGFGATSYTGEYGPEAGRRQGGMSFEEGSRNQPPHRDLARSAATIGPAFAGEVARIPDRLFWPT